jgi:hypothetical protein
MGKQAIAGGRLFQFLTVFNNFSHGPRAEKTAPLSSGDQTIGKAGADWERH